MSTRSERGRWRGMPACVGACEIVPSGDGIAASSDGEATACAPLRAPAPDGDTGSAAWGWSGGGGECSEACRSVCTCPSVSTPVPEPSDKARACIQGGSEVERTCTAGDQSACSVGGAGTERGETLAGAACPTGGGCAGCTSLSTIEPLAKPRVMMGGDGMESAAGGSGKGQVAAGPSVGTRLVCG
eukprot:scaffold3499_cov117-Isochrysis_galbana.AAC.22